MSGQSAASTPFMKVSDSSKSSNKKTVSFDTSETNDKIDKLTSLVSKMKVQMDKCDIQYKQQMYQSRRRGQNRHDYVLNDYQTRNRSSSRDGNRSYRVEEILVEF